MLKFLTLEGLKTFWGKIKERIDLKYEKPEEGIPKNDLAPTILTSLDKTNKIYIADFTVSELLLDYLSLNTIQKLITLRNNVSDDSLILLPTNYGYVPATIIGNGSNFSMYFYYNGSNIVLNGDSNDNYTVIKTDFYSKPQNGIPISDLDSTLLTTIQDLLSRISDLENSNGGGE